jgi:TolB protein
MADFIGDILMWTARIITLSAGLMVIVALMTIFAVSLGRFLPIPPMLAYIHQTNAEIGNVHLLDISRGVSIPLTQTNTQHLLPTWSPDGDYLLFVLGGNFNIRTGRFGVTRILQMNMTTYSRYPLTANRGVFNENSPAWSSTGKIAYAVYDMGWDIVIMRSQSAQTVLIGNLNQMSLNTQANEHTPKWSHDGSQLAYLVGGQFFSELAVADSNGANPRSLTTGMRVYQGQYDWSPTGTHIVFTSERDGNREIYLVNVTSGALINLSRHLAHDYAPAWSPDGTSIVFISERSTSPLIFVMGWDGSDVRPLTTISHYPTQVTWSPDGEWIVFSASDSTASLSFSRDLFIISSQGGTPRRLTFTPADDYAPIWKPK